MRTCNSTCNLFCLLLGLYERHFPKIEIVILLQQLLFFETCTLGYWHSSHKLHDFIVVITFWASSWNPYGFTYEFVAMSTQVHKWLVSSHSPWVCTFWVYCVHTITVYDFERAIPKCREWSRMSWLSRYPKTGFQIALIWVLSTCYNGSNVCSRGLWVLHSQSNACNILCIDWYYTTTSWLKNCWSLLRVWLPLCQMKVDSLRRDFDCLFVPRPNNQLSFYH